MLEGVKLRFIFANILVLLLVACGESSEYKRLGFADEKEMNEIHAKGWHTKERYLEDTAKAAGFSSYAEMQKVEDERRVLMENEKKKARNFLIGKCIVDAGDNSGILIEYACDASKAKQYPGTPSAVPYVIYKENTIQVNVIIGSSIRGNPQIAPNLQPKDVVIDFPVNYTFSGPNRIIAEVNARGGCITKTEFEIQGSEIYSLAMPTAGDCSSDQITANNYQMKQGRQKILYKLMNN